VHYTTAEAALGIIAWVWPGTQRGP
jgi:hypothetical protein